MEKIEKSLITNSQHGKNMIRASSILEITLEDYHNSRKGQLNIKHTEESNKGNKRNIYDEFESTQKKLTFSNQSVGKESSRLNSFINSNIGGENELKNLISVYIKERELDMYIII